AYPYKGVVDTCKSSTGFFKIKGYVSIKSCFELENVLATRPISVAVDGRNFRSYSSGIFDNCGTTLTVAGLAVSCLPTMSACRCVASTFSAAAERRQYNSACIWRDGQSSGV
ncbi:MAG: C1 family peptidase, partial [Flammeovirgaceae bacterium]